MIWLLFIFASVCLHVHGDLHVHGVAETPDFGSMRIKDLKARLADIGGTCRGCAEKRDFIKELKARREAIIADPSLAAKILKTQKKRTPPPPPEDAVIEGTADNFAEVVLQSKVPVMVEFFAPWCGHCKSLAPHWKAAASRLVDKVKMVTVDATIESELASTYEVTGYPTIKVFQPGNDKPEPYQGGREEDHLVRAGMELIGQVMPTVDVSDVSFAPENLLEGLATVPKALVAFTDSSCGKPCVRLTKNFMKVIKTLRKKDYKPEWALLYLVDCTDGGCAELGVASYPLVKYYENAKPVSDYELKTSTVKLLGFAKRPSVEKAKLPLPEKWDLDGEEDVPFLTPKNYKEVLQKHSHILVWFYAPWCGHCKSGKPDVIDTAQELAEQGDDAPGMIVSVDCTAYQSLCSRWKVKSFPTILHFVDGKNVGPYNGGRDKAGYLSFLDDPTEEQVKEEPFLDSGAEHSVTLLTDETYRKFFKNNPSVLVMFYAPWCGHCKSAKPGFAEAADELKGSGKVMAAIDCDVHKVACGKYDVQGFPTIKYFHKGKPSDYDGGRDKDGFLSFMESKSIKKSASQKEIKKASRETPAESQETPAESRETPSESHDEL